MISVYRSGLTMLTQCSLYTWVIKADSKNKQKGLALNPNWSGPRAESSLEGSLPGFVCMLGGILSVVLHVVGSCSYCISLRFSVWSCVGPHKHSVGNLPSDTSGDRSRCCANFYKAACLRYWGCSGTGEMFHVYCRSSFICKTLMYFYESSSSWKDTFI